MSRDWLLFLEDMIEKELVWDIVRNYVPELLEAARRLRELASGA